MKRETQGQKLFSFLHPSKNSDILLPGNKYLFCWDGFRQGGYCYRASKGTWGAGMWPPPISLCISNRKRAMICPFTELTLGVTPSCVYWWQPAPPQESILFHQYLAAILTLSIASSVTKAPKSLWQLAPKYQDKNALMSWNFSALHWPGLGVRGHRKKWHLNAPKIQYIQLQTRFPYSTIYTWTFCLRIRENGSHKHFEK